MKKPHPEPKPLFIERMKELLGEDFKNYLKILEIPPVKSIRCNTLKISPEKLKKRLEKKSWKIKQPWNENPEVMIIENPLEPGELGRALEHLLGYYYIQELASMLPVIALKPKKEDIILDLCSAPGSKTTQLAAEIGNTGTIIANEISLGRIKILASNLERCGVTNTIITKKDGIALCKKLAKQNLKLDKILVDAPCSGEGTLRSSPKTYLMWNINTIKQLSKIQKNLVSSAIELLKPNGELIYSTCTHAPEENEEVVDFILKEFKDKIKIEKISLPINPRQGIEKYKDKKYLKEVKCSCRIYPQDNNTEGFFIAKFRRVK
ncbi:MAG: RsmB/NOP family class I SAM-dependent RNA methyltransferase [Nanoarchaeota archaeon]|nr:RsmB/NOP family class I SAM-dependent RNA methyltransferase [Nanoarchaeota archaeon]